MQAPNDPTEDSAHPLRPEVDWDSGPLDGARRRHPSPRIPIRTLSAHHRPKILAHLIALEREDRHLRFGYAATDTQMERYVEGLDFDRDPIFGVVNRGLRLIAVAHLAYGTTETGHQVAEFGVSVQKSVRGRGYGSSLFDRAAMHTRNAGIDEIYIHALSENQAMLQIARRAGAVVVRYGAESEAHLRLPPPDLDSRVAEMWQQQWALADHHLKRRAWVFQRVLGEWGILRS